MANPISVLQYQVETVLIVASELDGSTYVVPDNTVEWVASGPGQVAVGAGWFMVDGTFNGTMSPTVNSPADDGSGWTLKTDFGSGYTENETIGTLFVTTLVS